ncbi:MAG: hypothetical protein A3H51_02785 [Candidatus Spechtbacteria bacterium RIFCSPLOWO2_02_FULL_38_8]|uniref:BioF2-like acetyltransferase domain-containing protein n=1 Tax=Candidatus Spechtbacteria bacterium RIFCSPLOWO2_02_FULL_38_8 TaxID=1802164 RepID=A0A1G2HG06_9BACT|nr:MAG: hypothetical protein A3H51_02785 [Candidatus Spechtbacteria bacterium RIFCSPLOWO2_02_FULL_38_8]
MSNTIELKIYEIKEKQVWENFVTSQLNYSFLHSWAWGEFNKNMGDKIWRLGVYEENQLIAAVLLIKVHAKRGNFLFVPHGPIFASSKKIINYQLSILNELTEEFKRLAQEEKTSFIRISPLLENTDKNLEIFKKLGYRSAPIYMHAETTWELELDKTEEELLYEMRKNTRNLVRRAEREGVKIVSGNNHEYINTFVKLYKETASRHSFVPFSKRYLENEISAFNQEENCEAKIYLTKYQNEYTAGAVIVFYGDSAYYHHGASSAKYKKIPAPYLIQWQAIREAKQQGRKYYNFWGIATDEENKKHPWYGLTLFKKGFGGFRKDHLHAQDLVASPLYWTSYVIDKMRMWRRGV